MKTLIISMLLMMSLTSLFAEEKQCYVQMDDSLNKDTTKLSVTKVSDTHFIVTDHYNYITKPELWSVDVFLEENKVWADAGVPGDIELEEFLKIYHMENDSQLTWTDLNNSCTELEKAFIYYLVM